MSVIVGKDIAECNLFLDLFWSSGCVCWCPLSAQAECMVLGHDRGGD
jgi:hypothetical protein